MAEPVHHVGHKKSAHIGICSSRQLLRMRGKRGTKSPVKSSRDVACAVSAMCGLTYPDKPGLLLIEGAGDYRG